MAPRFSSRKIFYSFPLLLNILVLIGSANCRYGAASSTRCSTSYNLAEGTYLPGSPPTRVQTFDTGCLITQSLASEESTPSNPSRYVLGGSTSWISGGLADLSLDNNFYMTFRSYYSGTDTIAFVDDDTSDVDFYADKGTHSSFSAQQAGPDSTHDTLTEENATNYELDLEVQWTNMSYHEASEELAIYVAEANNTYSLNATGGYMIVGDGTPDWGSTAGTISFWVKMHGSVQGRFWGQDTDMETRFSVGSNLILDWGASNSMASNYSFSPDTWYFVAIVWDENNNNLFLYIGDKNNLPTLDANSLNGTWTRTTPAPQENRFLNGLGTDEPVDGQGDDLRYWDIARNLTEIQSDYNAELAGSEPNLRSYFQLDSSFDDIGPDNNDGSGFGPYVFSQDVSFASPSTEDIHVDVWHSGSWQSLFTELNAGWNNVSVSSYLDSPTFTIRFKGSMENGDTIQDSWNIDVALLHVWSKEYRTEVEFAGSSDLGNWSEMNWTTSMGWTSSSVRVTMQLYDYYLGDFSRMGNGYLNYISSVLPQEDETRSQVVADNPDRFRNSTGHWMIRIKGVKAAETQFDLKVDWIEIRPSSEYAHSLDWSGILTYTLPVVFGLLVIPILVLRRRKRTKPSFVDKVHPFSRAFGMTHQQMAGQKMLLEIDPTVDFQKAIFNFATEAKNSKEKLFIFTSKSSPLHLKFSGTQNTEFYLLVSKAPSSEQKSPKETLLPASDLSVLLNTITRIQGAETGKPVNILFDNLSDTMVLCGFEKTYKFIRWLLEATSSPEKTILFVFNPTAHDPKTSSSIRGLFQTRLAYGKNGPRVGTL